MSNLPVCIYVHHVPLWCLWRLEERFGFPELYYGWLWVTMSVRRAEPHYQIFFSCGIPPKCHLAFCHYVSFSSSELQQLLRLPLLWNMAVLKSQVLCRISFNLDFSNVCLIIWLKMLTGEKKIAERKPLSWQWSKAPEISTTHGCCYQLYCPDAGWCLPGFFFL